VSRGAGRRLDFVVSDDDAISAHALRWCKIDGLADVPLAQAVQTGNAVFVPSVHDLATRYPHLVERQLSLGTRRMAALPLATRDSVVGGLLLSFAAEQDFDYEERAYLAAFAAQVTQALRRALAYQVEQTTSERLQRSLMPQSLPDLSELSLGAQYRPGGFGVDVGGDWYDVVELPDGSVGVALGDVMGKGVPAAIVMGQVRAAMRAYALLDPSPGLVMERLDKLIASFAVPEQIVTVAYGLIDRDRREMTLSIAGHPPPLVVPPTGEPWLLDTVTGPPLGLGAGPWPETRIDLLTRLTVLFYSDGLVETRSMHFFDGMDRLCRRVAEMESRRRNPREMCARLAAVLPAADAIDDVTLLAITSTAQLPVRTAAAQLPGDTSASPLSRQFVGQQLQAWDLDHDLVEIVQLCVSEVVTNAVIHSGTAPRLTLRLDDEYLLVLVQDSGGRGAARVSDVAEPLDISGRGLALVEKLTAAWGAEHSADGTTVCFDV